MMLVVSPRETVKRNCNPHIHANMDERASILQYILSPEHRASIPASIACLRRLTQSKLPRDKDRKYTDKRKKSQKNIQLPNSKKRRRDIENDTTNVNSPKCRTERNSAEYVQQVPCTLTFDFDKVSPVGQAISPTETIAVDVDTCESSNKAKSIEKLPTIQRPPRLNLNIESAFAPTPRGVFDVKTSKKKMSNKKKKKVRFSSNTKLHDGLCKPSQVIEDIVRKYFNVNVLSVGDLKSFCTKEGRHNHLPFVSESIKTLIVSLKNAAPGDELPLLPRGGGSGFLLTSAHLKDTIQLYNMLLQLQ